MAFLSSEKRLIREVDQLDWLLNALLGLATGAFVLGPAYPFFALMCPDELITDPILALLYVAYSALSAMAYGLILQSARRSGCGIGIQLSTLHWLVLTSLMTMVPSTRSLLAMAGWSGLFLWTIWHVAYGAVLGRLYDWAALLNSYPSSIDDPRFKLQSAVRRPEPPQTPEFVSYNHEC